MMAPLTSFFFQCLVCVVFAAQFEYAVSQTSPATVPSANDGALVNVNVTGSSTASINSTTNGTVTSPVNATTNSSLSINATSPPSLVTQGATVSPNQDILTTLPPGGSPMTVQQTVQPNVVQATLGPSPAVQGSTLGPSSTVQSPTPTAIPSPGPSNTAGSGTTSPVGAQASVKPSTRLSNSSTVVTESSTIASTTVSTDGVNATHHTIYGRITQFWEDYQYILSIAIPVCVGTLLALFVLCFCFCCNSCKRKNRRGKKKANNKKFHELKNLDRVMLLAESSDDEI